MKFEVYGPFKLTLTDKNGRLVRAKEVRDNFVKEMINDKTGNKNLPDACGCYVFVIRAQGGTRPWYAGKTEKMTFSRECLSSTNITRFNRLLSGRGGIPELYLLPQMTRKGGKFRSPTTSKRPAIDFLESMFIGMGVQRNKDLDNIRKTKMLRELTVAGFMNYRGAPTTAAKKLRKVFGLK